MLDKKFDPKSFEDEIFKLWEDNKIFQKKKSESSRKDFFMIIPPPNVTGKLHIGHAWNTTIQDAILRFKKMQGYNAWWIAGMDHAGIATQTKYESEMRKNKIEKKYSSRKEYFDFIYEWAQDNANSIRSQWKKLGLGLDYSHEYFTLEKKVHDNIIDLFIKLYNDGLVYKKYTLVNWDVKLKTAISNVEVIHKETNSKMYYIKYDVIDSSKKLIVATTRPETMFADTCLVVNPKDKRYKDIIGKKVINPANEEQIPIIADSYVEYEFGTGVMKCTPAHDFNDYKLGLKYKQKFYSCMNEDGTMNSLGKEFEGLDRLECRKKLIEKLNNNNFIEKIEDIKNSVGYSERTDEIVEPFLSKQWFIKMKPLAKKVIDLQKKEKGTKFFPLRFNNELLKWIKNIEDWCISRQLKWGHQIPAWYKKGSNEIYVGKKSPGKDWIQDEDVFDTWFSSGSLPFTTTNFTFENKDVKNVTSNVLVTAYDILFFWVARMMMLTLYSTNKIPFKDVLIHGLIRDSQNRKMSKTLGNGVDPMDVIDNNGCDALRLFLLSSTTVGEDLIYNEQKLNECKFFLNKLWNTALYISQKKNISNLSKNIQLHDFDKWILNKTNTLYKEFNNNFEKYNFAVATKALMKFVREDLSSAYIELNKNRNDHALSYTLYKVLKIVLHLLHPLSPFITEKIYKEIYGNKKSILLDEIKLDNIKPSKNIVQAINILDEIRIFKWENKLSKSNELNVNVYSIDKKLSNNQLSILEEILKYENVKLTYVKEQIDLKKSKYFKKNIDNLVIEIIYEVNESENKEKLVKEKEFLLSEIKRSESLLSNKGFVQKAPEQLIKKEKEKLEKYKKDLENLMKKF